MTIAIGILATDGVVLAADTQQTYEGIAKIDLPKILIANQCGNDDTKLAGFAVSGAGWSDYLEAASQELCGRFLALRRPTIDSIKGAVATAVRRFYQRHMVPFAQFPDHDRPNLQLLIAAQCPSGQRLWATRKNTLRECQRFAAVGIGEAYARMLLARYANKGMTIANATALAAYAVFSAKQFVEGCGRETHVVRICASTATYYPKEKVDFLEGYFQKYLGAERNTLRYALGLLPTDAETQESFYKYFRGLRSQVEELERFTLQSSGLGDHRVEQPEWKRVDDEAVSRSKQRVLQSPKRGLKCRPPSRA
jgi:20S proteasome alpha/beta subunit